MNILAELRQRFLDALEPLVDDPGRLLEMILPVQDPRFGDYQANCAMPLGKERGCPPRDVASEIVERLKVEDLCEPVEIAGPGFINLRLRDDWLIEQVNQLVHDQRLGVDGVDDPDTVVIDYSSPNVAKPMHVGHIRSTVIGDALARILRFLGHQVIADNHLGDWGTQFGMIIYGYKHFVDSDRFENDTVNELSRLYRLVNDLVEYHQAVAGMDRQLEEIREREEKLAQQQLRVDKAGQDEKKKQSSQLRRQQTQLEDARGRLAGARKKIDAVDEDQALATLAAEHPGVAEAVLGETARLHEGDSECRQLWKQFLPACRAEIDKIYQRLDIQFDVEYGESFYHSQLEPVVEELLANGLARMSEQAVCVFGEKYDTPMIIRKKDGAFLYATTDLATIQYRVATWQPDTLLYVVDHRQGEHFEKLFDAARRWNCPDLEMRHVSFGTVLGDDGKPFKTRSGEVVGLESLLDGAVARALEVVSENDQAKPGGPELAEQEREHIASVVGHAAIKYADLAHNRTSDYVFSYDKMMALEGNTATYMQYSYARVQSIFRRGEVDVDGLRSSFAGIQLQHPAERQLALGLLQFSEALDQVLEDYRPNQLTNYLFDVAKRFSTFFQECPVLRAEDEAVRLSRLLLCDVTARVIGQGLELLGIGVVDRM
ncbi:MAG: arginine--tRNA ligase [Planctomycetota bacterium]|nr:arginine--tRNA ligase [Planctomycetota bacterium]